MNDKAQEIIDDLRSIHVPDGTEFMLLCECIEKLQELSKPKDSEIIEELKDFCIWLTGCGYDFTQHEYFNKQRDKLLKQ